MENKKNSERQPKKPYRTPKLSSYGDVSQITRGGGGTKSDAGGPLTKSG